MTRRIALAILFTVWAMLIAGGVVAYMTTRSVLLADLDRALVARAASLPQLVSSEGGAAPLLAHPGDRYIIKGETRTLARPTTLPAAGEPPAILSATFSELPGGKRVRSVTIRALARTPETGGELAHVTVTYSGSAEQYDAILSDLAIALAVFGGAGGVVAAGLATVVSRAALRPLRATAAVIGDIDERRLDRRVETTSLPPELAPMAERLNELLTRLEQAFAQRKQFLADASHELRTPVAALVTGLEVALGRDRDADAYRRILETCLRDGRLLRQLVQRLMEQVRSETLSHEDQLEMVNVDELLGQCADVAEALGTAREIRVVRSIPAGARFVTQPARLRSIVTNLLSNAVEYNRPGGTVELNCTCNGSGLGLSVRDTGVGIAASDLPHVFEPFYRSDKTRTHSGEHLGLGLALVAAHAKALGGSCRVESQVSVGTTFECLLPPAQAPAEEAA